jgi:hypothetical protein
MKITKRRATGVLLAGVATLMLVAGPANAAVSRTKGGAIGQHHIRCQQPTSDIAGKRHCVIRPPITRPRPPITIEPPDILHPSTTVPSPPITRPRPPITIEPPEVLYPSTTVPKPPVTYGCPPPRVFAEKDVAQERVIMCPLSNGSAS